MFKISRRQTILRASLLGCLVVAVLSTAAYFIINRQEGTNALTKLDDRVDVIYDPSDNGLLQYGNADHPVQANTAHHTRHYNVQLANGTQYDGYCAQPKNGSPVTDPDDPDDYYKAKLLSNNSKDGNGGAIKLIIYLDQHDPNNVIFNNIDDDEAWGNGRTHRRYVFTHAVIGALYETPGDYTGLNELEQYRVNNAIERLRALINENAPVWQQANTYQLYRTETKKGTQDVVWIEQTGSIIVQKCDDKITSSCVPQGNGSFEGISFTLTQGSTTIDTKTIPRGANSVTFTGLDLDLNYTVTETSTNTIYNLTASPQSTKPTASGKTLTFRNEIKKGKLTVNKIDKETGDCRTITNGLTLAGITFNLYNTSTNSVYYENSSRAVNSLVASRTLTSDNPCSVSFQGLPYGRYELEEVIPDNLKGWVKDTTRKSITIHPNSDGETVTYNFENQPIRGDITFVKKDSTNNTPMANAVFEISSISENYTENHIVIADANGLVDTRASVNPHTNHTNGYDELYYASETPIAYAGYGTWFGRKNNGNPITPRNDVGALPYGSYLIQELKCDTNMFCSNINNEKKTFTITTHNQVVNLNDANSDSWGNDCAEFTLGTTATDSSDDDRYIEVGQQTSIKDVVTYCAKKNYSFTIKGILMDKSTNQPLLINGETVEQSVEISPTDNDCGTVEMLFPIDSSDLAGKSIVVFEKLYYKNEVKASHEDINDPEQTIDIISLGTVAVDNSDDDKLIVPSEETVIKDTVSYCAPIGQSYTITGVLMDKTTGNPILVDNEPVAQSVTFTPQQTCGTVELIFPAIDTTAIAGHPIVAYETLYKVIPGEPGEPDTEEPILPHEDPNDPDQTVYVIDISTTVQPTEDGTKVFPFDSDVTVTDMVHYCLQPGLEYTIKGIVMDKSTGNGLLVDSELVEQSVTFTPTEVCGEFPMYYTFNTKGLAGAQLVIFESLYYDDELLIEHKDIDNELESFEIDITPPETGFITKNASGSQEASHQELIVIAIIAIAPVGVYTFNRRQARKHFLNR